MEYLPTPYEVIDRPLWWHLQGLQQTASGYGSKLTTSRMIRTPDGRLRRVYCVCWSNSGSCYVLVKGKPVYLGALELGRHA